MTNAHNFVLVPSVKKMKTEMLAAAPLLTHSFDYNGVGSVII